MTAAPVKHGKLFTAAKVSDAIPLTTPLLADALIQACLDPQISRISMLSTCPLSLKEQAQEFVVLYAGDGRRLALDLDDESRPRDVDHYGLFLLAVERAGLDLVQWSRSEIRQEPLFSNCRIVWSHASDRVAIGDRIRIMQMLSEDGPLPIGDIVRNGTYGGDPSAALMALACHDVIELDLNVAAIGPRTNVRIRRGGC
jgi:hypothetical protein